MKDYIKNELVCLRAMEPIGSDRYNELSKAIQWIDENTIKKPAETKKATKHNYAHTTIRWKDYSCCGGEEYDVIFKLNAKRDFLGNFEKDPHDEKIFFYCESEDEFKSIASGYDNGEEFEVIGCILFTEEL